MSNAADAAWIDLIHARKRNWFDHIVDLALGLAYGYPICCVVAYAAGWTSFAEDGLMTKARQIGPDREWVPCVFHKDKARWT